MPYRNGRHGNGFRFAATNAKSYISLHPVLGFNGPRLVTHLCQRRSQQSFSGFVGICTSFFKKHIRVLKTECREALNLIRVVAHLMWGGDRDTILMLYQTIARSKLNYGSIVYGTSSNTNLCQLVSIHNSAARLAVGAFCTIPVSPVCTRRPTKLLWKNVGWSCQWITIWKLVLALTTRHIMPYMDLTQW